MKSLLFVDDEANILDGLRRMFRGMRGEWEMAFASDANTALEMMKARPFDIVVSDMRMPGMDGAELLTEVEKRYPETIRIILSGHSERESLLKSIGPSHQYLSKPCDSQVLKQVVDRALSLHSLVRGDRMKELACRLTTIPSMPSLYRQIIQELNSADCSLARVGQIIAKDIGMSAKVLKIVNSAYFGLPNPLSTVERAVTFLGLETINSLVLCVHIFSEYEGREIPEFSIDSLWKHSLRTAFCARALASEESLDRRTIDEVFMAAMLHDVGKLVVAANLPDEYAQSVRRAHDEGSSNAKVEQEVFGASHDEVGIYLLGLWGIPNSILEPIAFHSNEISTHDGPLDARVVVRIADLLVKEHDDGSTELAAELTALGLEERGTKWREVCRVALKEEQG